MAISALTPPPDYAALFRRRVVANARYWQSYVAERTADVEALDSERGCILKAVSFALELEPAWPYAYDLIVAFSPYMERRGYWQAWGQVLDQALKSARRMERRAEVVAISMLMARLLQRQGRFKQATTHYRQVIRAARLIGDSVSEARACSNLGYLYTEQGHWWRAETLCLHALTIFEQVDHDHGRAHTENHLGFLYIRQHDWLRAQQHLERACTIWQKMGDNHGLMRGFINLGTLYIKMEQPDTALSYLEKALYCAELTGEMVEIGIIYIDMGISYRLKGQSAQAEAYARRAEKIFQDHSALLELAFLWNNLGLACLDQGKWKEAIAYQEAALDAWRKLGSRHDELKTQLYMVEHELARGNWSQAGKKLAEIEALINRYDPHKQDTHLQTLLQQYGRSLAEQSTHQAAAH